MRFKVYLLLALLWPGLSMCQDITVRGKVIDEEGRPIAKATVKVIHQGEKIAPPKERITITDEKGEWSMKDTRLNDLIIVTAAGYETVQEVNNERGLVTITLKRSVKLLDEVKLETGYEQIAKERATGSFTYIDEAKFNEITGTNVLDRLSYMANGLTAFSERIPTMKGSIVIRGLSSYSVKDVLIVLDNFPYEGDPANINPNDVESITILKDAAAASIWGAKAGNGVIVITTKKGKYNQRTRVDFNMNFSTTGEPQFFDYPIINSSEYIDVEKFLFSKGFRFSDTSSSSHPPFSPVYEILFKLRKGQITQAQADAQIDALRSLDVRNDFLKYFYRPSFNQQYSINLRGGTNTLAWAFSAGVDRNSSILNDDYNRYSFRFNNSYKLTKNIDLNAAVSYTISDSWEGNPAYGTIIGGRATPQYTQLADQYGNALALYNKFRQGYIDTVGAGKLLDWKYYPLTDNKYEKHYFKTTRFTTQTGVTARIIKGLTADVRYEFQREQVNKEILYDQRSYYARDLINKFSQLNRSTGVVSYKIPVGDIFDQLATWVRAFNIRGQLNFNRSFGQHSISALAGAETSERITGENGYRSYGYNTSTLNSVNVDYANAYPTFMNGSSAFIPNAGRMLYTNYRFVSLYGNAGYTFLQRYGLTISGRRDAANFFGVKANDRWSPLWSIGGRWVISSEKFYKLKRLTYLQIRLTYGKSGNADPSRVAVTTLSIGGINPYTNTPYANILNYPNPTLKWEKAGMLNIAVDFKSPNERIAGSFEYFRKSMSDLGVGIPSDPTTGTGGIILGKNSGILRGSGFDMEINTVILDKALKWTTQFILNYYKDKKTTTEISNSYNSKLATAANLYGYPLNSYFALRWAGLNDTTGDPQGYLNGQISKDYTTLIGSGVKESDLVYIGPMAPLYFGSLGNTVSWKGISLTFRILYKFNYFFRRPYLNYANLFESGKGHSDFRNRWQKPGDAVYTDIPSMIYPNISNRDVFYSYSEVLATRGDHIRLQYINLSYKIPNSILSKISMTNGSFYVVINNVGIIWKANKYGLDPDFENGSPAASFSAGFRTSF